MEKTKFSRTDILRKVIKLQDDLQIAISSVETIATGQYGIGLFKTRLQQIHKSLDEIRRYI